MSSQQVQWPRFTLDGSSELEQHLASVCARVGAEVRALIPEPSLEGLLLGGGYGRGEGGVLRGDSEDQPYNDLEFYIFVRGCAWLAERRYRGALHALGHRLSPAAGLEIEFKVLTLDRLRRSSPSMFFYDLWSGHRWIFGDDRWLAGCEHHGDARRIPLAEATRLLMNRCSGLLFSAERLRRPHFGLAEADYVGRNLAKAQLALGDVCLVVAGQYHWSCRERHRRLGELPTVRIAGDADAVRRHHAAGLAFKLHPVRSTATRESLAELHKELSELAWDAWRWLEQRRLGAVFATPRDYALSAVDKCPETRGWRNRLVNTAAFGPAAGLGIQGGRYPRQRLLHALCLLLWEDQLCADDRLRRRVQSELNNRTYDFPGLVAAYERLWHRFH